LYFLKKDLKPIKVIINNEEIKSKSMINVIGILFDTKLNWQAQIDNSVHKSRKTLQAIRLFSKS